jgi:hypothetical protein
MRLLSLASLLFYAACLDPGIEAAYFKASVVIDPAVFSATKAFQVVVYGGKNKQGAVVTCDEFPSTYRDGDSQLVIADAGQTIPWSGATTQADVALTAVPAGERLLVSVLALAPYAGGTQIVGRGCAEPKEPFKAGSQDNLVEVDVVAATGKSCGDPSECESGLTCTSDALLGGGYCAKVGCGSPQDCPPGSACVYNSATGGFCAQACSVLADCNALKGLECLKRSGPGACSNVCVSATWNEGSQC